MNGFYWLASYPKSGNTWLRMFLESLAAGGSTPNINALETSGSHAAIREAFDRILDIASADLTDREIACARPRQYEIEAQTASEPMLRKAHDAWEPTPAGEPLFPPALTLGAVYLVRDPRDVAVSMAHHMNKSIDQAIARMSDPEALMSPAIKRLPKQLPQRLSTWSGHVESWLNAPIPKLLLRYEDMRADAETYLTEAARFLGFETAPETIAAAIEATRFDRLQAQEEAEGFAETPAGMKRFFRRGIAGGWKDSLTAEQIARIEADHGPMMAQLGYL